MQYFCCDQHRRNSVRKHPTLNGIDYLEVLDRDAPTKAEPNAPGKGLRQRTLLVHCLKPIPDLSGINIGIAGGERITPIKVLWAFPGSGFSTDPAVADGIPNSLVTAEERNFFVSSLPERDRVLVVRTDTAGDFSTYRLYLRKAGDNSAPPDNFDPLLSAVDFSFKVECPSDFDCQTERICPPEPQSQPEINYLAKDYASFRQLMLDRLALLMPQWRERNPADLGIALVELLAYVGDYLSYQQDAIATEAYLGTARRRTSVRRHARLVDYFMHDGCNARVWVQVEVNAKNLVLKRWDETTKICTRFLTRCLNTQLINDSQFQQVLNTHRPEVFEPLHDIELYEAHNTLFFYTWGNERCCLPKGATHATLKDSYFHLKAGDVLIFEEVLGSKTGKPEDADPTHRHAVRLEQVVFQEKRQKDGTEKIVDLTDPLTNQAITQIRWRTEDALPFPLCISTITDREHGEEYKEDVSVARGNIVLADHGYTIEKPENLGTVPEVQLFRVPVTAGDRCQPVERKPVPPRFNPRLQQAPLTQTGRVKKIDSVTKQPELVPFDPDASATAAFQWQMENVIPAITLHSKETSWEPQRDLLLSSRASDPHFVVEVEGDGVTTIRFGNGSSDSSNQIGQHGLRSTSGTTFSTTYRVGNGRQGNIGAETLFHIVTTETAIVKIRNPLPAQGGIDPESIEEVRQSAPSAFRTQERAVTPEDYAALAERYPGVQRATAIFRWTGSWRTVFVTVDRLGGQPVDTAFKDKMRQHLERFRLVGHDLEIDGPRYVPLEIEMQVCVNLNYFRTQVKKALLEVFSNRILPDGRRGVFHPDNFTFGQPVYLSPLYAAAQAVEGVASVQVTLFQRQGTPSTIALAEGKLELGRLEIARLDNDPNFPDRGVFRLTMEGGK